MITEGIAAFVNLSETERYNGQDTGKFSIVINMDPDEAAKVEAAGIKVKEYKNQPQRKFASKFDVQVVDSEGLSLYWCGDTSGWVRGPHIH